MTHKPAFLVADIRVINREKYDDYRRRFRACVAHHRGHFLARGQEVQVIQGGWHPPRMLLVEFADSADASAMLASEEYRELEQSRGNCAMFDIVILEGLETSKYTGREIRPVYAIADTRIVNRAAFEEFRARIDAAVLEHDGRYLALAEKVDTVAGNWAPTFISIMEFSSPEAANSAYKASGYLEVRERGNNAAMIDMVMLSGEAPDALP